MYNLARIDYKENVSSPATSKMVNSVTENFTPRTNPEPDAFNSKLYHKFKELITGLISPNLLVYNTIPEGSRNITEEEQEV